MKNLFSLLFLLLGSIVALSQPLINSEPDKPGWELYFQDKFDDENVFLSSWEAREGYSNPGISFGKVYNCTIQNETVLIQQSQNSKNSSLT